MNKFSAVFSFLCLILILGCGKDHALRWIVMKVKVVDSETGDPILAYAQISYKKKHTHAEKIFSSNEGISYHDRTIVVKHKIKGNEYSHRLEIFLYDDYNFICYSSYPNFSLGVAPNADKDVVLSAQRRYRYNIKLKNINCFGATDSVFISSQQIPLRTFTGCMDSTLYSVCYPSTVNNIVHISVLSKKNGVTTDLSQDFSLTYGQINELLIEY